MGKALLTFCFPLKNILRRKIHWQAVRFPNYTMTRNPLHSIYFPSDHCRLENTVKFTIFKTPFSFLRWYLDYVYYKNCCGSSPIPSEASNLSPGSPSLPTSAPASPQSSSAAPPGRPGEWHCKTQGSQTARKIILTSQVNIQQLCEETLEQRRKKPPKVIFRKGHQSSWEFWYPFMSVQRIGLLSVFWEKKYDPRWLRALVPERKCIFFFLWCGAFLLKQKLAEWQCCLMTLLNRLSLASSRAPAQWTRATTVWNSRRHIASSLLGSFLKYDLKVLLRKSTASPLALHRNKCCKRFDQLCSAGFKKDSASTFKARTKSKSCGEIQCDQKT